MQNITEDSVIAVITPVDEDVSELSEEEQELLAEQLRAEELAKQEMLENIAISITSKYEQRANRRSSKENEWLRSTNLYYGKLHTSAGTEKRETPFQLNRSADRPDVNIVRSKCFIAIAQTYSMQFGATNKNWDLFPAKNADDPENSIACAKMSDEMERQTDKAKYPYQSRLAMWDRVVLGTGILKGPMSEGELVRSYVKLDGSDTWVPELSVMYTPQAKRINPWFFYPDETVSEVDKLGDTIEVHPMSPLELKKLTKHEGFKADAILEVLKTAPKEYNNSNWNEFAHLTSNNPDLYKGKYLVLEYHGPITKQHLDQLCIEPTYDSLDDEYYGEVWVCNNQVIRIELETIEASFRVPYYLCPWEKDPSSVFGFGVPLMMEDAQRVVNESWHMILDNSSASSGPQVALQKGLIAPQDNKWELTPDKIWYLTDPQATVAQAIQFFNIPNVTGDIVPIMQMAQEFAEEESCIPLIAAGLGSPQVTDTATGGMMVQQASTTILDFMSEDWDDNITAPYIQALYAWNMQYNDNPEIKGAFSVDVRTSTEYKNKQLHIRDLEKLSVEAAQNPELAKRLDQGALARLRLTMMTLPSKEVIKTEEQVAEEEAAAAENAMPDPTIMELQLKARELSLKEAQLEFETQQAQQREAWDHEERMAAVEARFNEAAARVAVSQNEKETKILELAAKRDETAMRLMSQETIQKENNQTKAFIAGMQESRKNTENELFQTELQLKAITGSGI